MDAKPKRLMKMRVFTSRPTATKAAPPGRTTAGRSWAPCATPHLPSPPRARQRRTARRQSCDHAHDAIGHWSAAVVRSPHPHVDGLDLGRALVLGTGLQRSDVDDVGKGLLDLLVLLLFPADDPMLVPLV